MSGLPSALRRAPPTGVLALLVGIAVAGAIAVAVVPRALGGATSYAVVAGSSMEPRLSPGDLAVLREAGDYDVGDVVGFSDASLGHVVVHRIVDRDEAGFVTRGDANDFRDPGRVRPSDVVGTLRVRIPWVGHAIVWLRNPLHAGLLAAALVIAMGIGGSRTARGASLVRRTAGLGRRLPAWRPGAEALWIVTLVGVTASGALLALALARPTTRVAQIDNLLAHQGRFSYSAPAPRGAAYPTGTVATGDAVFRRLVDEVEFRFTDRITTRDGAAIAGTAALTATISDGAGWSHRIELQEDTAFEGALATATGALDLGRLAEVIGELERTTGAESASYTLVVEGDIRIETSIAGRALHDRFAPPLRMRLDPVRLSLEAPPALESDVQDPLSPTRSRSGTRNEPTTLGPQRLRLPVAWARVIGLLGLGAGLVGLLALAAAGAPAAGSVARVLRTRSVRVSRRTVPEGSPVVRLSSLEALARIAEARDRPILVCERGEWRSHVVADAGGVFYEHVERRAPRSATDIVAVGAREG